MRLARPLLALSLGLLLMAPAAHAKDKDAAPDAKNPLKYEQVKVPVPPELVNKLDANTIASLNKLSEAIHWEDRSIYQELRDEEDTAVTDIGMLWQAAVERSGTIRYAIEKLSRRDATGQPLPGDDFGKRMLNSLVQLGGVAGSMWTGTPAGLIGGSLVQDLMAGNPQDSAYARVTDADMVLLAKEVEALQTDIIEKYYAYRHAQERLDVTDDAVLTIAKYYDHAAQSKDPTMVSLQPLMQSIYESAKQDQRTAAQNVASARTSLVLLVGPDAVAALDSAKESQKADQAGNSL